MGKLSFTWKLEILHLHAESELIANDNAEDEISDHLQENLSQKWTIFFMMMYMVSNSERENAGFCYSTGCQDVQTR